MKKNVSVGVDQKKSKNMGGGRRNEETSPFLPLCGVTSASVYQMSTNSCQWVEKDDFR